MFVDLRKMKSLPFLSGSLPSAPSCRVVPGRLSSVSSSTLDTIDPEDTAAPFVCPTETLSQNKALISVRWLFAVFLETSYRTKITPG